eukprot:1155565-Pelagomonas_calceolata.AAC.4
MTANDILESMQMILHSQPLDDQAPRDHVSAASQPKGVAGKLAHSARESEPPATLCIGAASINQAVKSICIARQYLTRDGLNLSFQVGSAAAEISGGRRPCP